MAIDSIVFSDVNIRESYLMLLRDNIHFFTRDSDELLRVINICLGGNIDVILTLYFDGSLDRSFEILNSNELRISANKNANIIDKKTQLKDLISFLREYIQYLKAICASRNLPRPVTIPENDNEIIDNALRLASLSES